MKLRTWLALPAFVLAMSSSAFAADIGGKWSAEFETQVGTQKYVYEFKVDGDKITGKATADRGGEKSVVDLKDVKVAGDAVSFVEALSFQEQSIAITYTGKIAGDEIKLTRKVGEVATEELVAKRVKDAAPAKTAEPAKPATPAKS